MLKREVGLGILLCTLKSEVYVSGCWDLVCFQGGGGTRKGMD